jgi:transcriptional regulator with XRE-family HTH domain
LSTRGSPSIRRRRLGIELRRLREDAGLTIEIVAERLECSPSKISRIENGLVGATPRDVRDMLEIYGVTGEPMQALIQVAREAREKGWWNSYADLGNVALVGFEAAAASIATFDVSLVPSLLQTPEYARSILRAMRPELDPTSIERRVEFRMTRQRVLTERKPPSFWAVLDEAVLRRPVGGRGMMTAQILHLVESARLPNITIQVLPFAAGEHAGMSGSFTLLNFAEPADPDVVYLENFSSDLYLESPVDVQRYRSLFDYVRAAALPFEGSLNLLTELAKERNNTDW